MAQSFRIALVLSLVATPLLGQVRPPPKQTPPPKGVTTVQAPKPRLALDFQDQDIKVVLSALAEAGQMNVTFSNLPAKKVTLRMGQPATQAEFRDMIKGIAEVNDLKVTESGNLLTIVGPPAPVPVQQVNPQAALLQSLLPAELKLYTYRLKHASATQLAPVLMSLFSGSTTVRQTTTTPNGFTQTITPGVIGGVAPVPAAGAAGGGGGGGGRGNNGGGAAHNAFGGRGAGGAANAITQALQQGGLAGLGGLSSSSADIRIVGEETSNSLLVRATAADWALIQGILTSVDLRPLQVLIEVTIAEVSRTHDLNVGISGTLSHKTGNINDSATAPSGAGALDFIAKLTGGHGIIDYNVALNALQSRGDVRVLSLPVIIAQNNRQAILNEGEQRPFVQVAQSVVTGSVPTTVQTIQYLDVGTVLTITPTINPDGYVNMVVDQTDNNATTEVEFNAPVISTREASTQVFLKDGQTTVIGGLSGKTTSHQQTGIPILSAIPFIGPYLFGHTEHSTTTSELYLFLTPHVIFADEDIDKLREAVKDGSELLKQVPVDARIVPHADTIHVPPGDSIRMRTDSIARARGGRGGGGGR